MRAQWFGWMLVGVVSSCTPQANRQGAVECSTDGVCPPGFLCSFRRCCPADAGARECPTAEHAPRVPDGGLECNARGECPNAHGYTCRLGVTCCPSGTDGTGACSPGAPGVACTAATRCDPIQTVAGSVQSSCLTEAALPIPLLGDAIRITVPEGYCSAPCKGDDFRSCGATGYCIKGLRIPDSPAEFNGICAARCTNPAGQSYSSCRSDQSTGGTRVSYSCFPLAPGSDSREGFCFPDCTRFNYCDDLNNRYRLLLLGNEIYCDPVTRGCASRSSSVRDR